MTLDYIVADDFGQVLKITFIDVDTSQAADISSYTDTIQMIFTKPDGTVVPKTALFDTDGSDGVIKYTVDQDFLTAGQWKVRGRVKSGTATLSTAREAFDILS